MELWRRWDNWWEGVSGFRPTTEVTRGNGTRYAYRAWVAGVTLSLETEIHDFARTRRRTEADDDAYH